MNILALIAITWIGKEYRFLGLDWSYLVVLGFIGNATFSMRCYFFNAFPCAMAGLRAAGRKRDTGLVLVLEHRRQRDHVFVLYFQTGPCRHSRLFAQLAYLHS